jgi:hypothetical protein
MSDQDSTIDLGGYGAIPSNYGTDTITLGTDTITLDSSSWITGASGSTMISNGGYTGSTTVPFTWNTNATTSGYSFNTSPNTIHINSDGLTMAEGTDITVGGKSLTKAIEQIEERLGILHPNPKLEERWDQLKELRKQYIEMEKDLLEKEKLMKILKEA